jgi:cobalt-zinc-cadmium efflux system protein
MSFGMLRRTSSILMETAPPDLDSGELISAVESIDGVENLHHLHVWELDEHHVALEAHVVVDVPETERMPLRNRIKDLLRDRFAIGHSTLELETPEENCRDTEPADAASA